MDRGDGVGNQLLGRLDVAAMNESASIPALTRCKARVLVPRLVQKPAAYPNSSLPGVNRAE
jgi:hypothetical protein